MESYFDILTDTPGRTTAAQHVITLADSKFVTKPQYPIPLHYEEVVIKELKELLDMKVVENSDSPNSSPLLSVNKKRSIFKAVYRHCLVH